MLYLWETFISAPPLECENLPMYVMFFFLLYLVFFVMLAVDDIFNELLGLCYVFVLSEEITLVVN